MDKQPITNEASIVAAFQSGDRERFAELYDAYLDRIYAFIMVRIRHRETAEDLTSKTFMKALDRLGSYRGGSFSAWLYRIARNTVIDHIRTSHPAQDIETTVIAAEGDPNSHLDQKLEVEKIASALQQLSPAQRDVVTMRLWDDLSYDEIAALTGKSPASCRMAFSRAMPLLHQTLATALLLFISSTLIHG